MWTNFIKNLCFGGFFIGIFGGTLKTMSGGKRRKLWEFVWKNPFEWIFKEINKGFLFGKILGQFSKESIRIFWPIFYRDILRNSWKSFGGRNFWNNFEIPNLTYERLPDGIYGGILQNGIIYSALHSLLDCVINPHKIGILSTVYEVSVMEWPKVSLFLNYQ